MEICSKITSGEWNDARNATWRSRTPYASFTNKSGNPSRELPPVDVAEFHRRSAHVLRRIIFFGEIFHLRRVKEHGVLGVLVQALQARQRGGANVSVAAQKTDGLLLSEQRLAGRSRGGAGVLRRRRRQRQADVESRLCRDDGHGGDDLARGGGRSGDGNHGGAGDGDVVEVDGGGGSLSGSLGGGRVLRCGGAIDDGARERTADAPTLRPAAPARGASARRETRQRAVASSHTALVDAARLGATAARSPRASPAPKRLVARRPVRTRRRKAHPPHPPRSRSREARSFSRLSLGDCAIGADATGRVACLASWSVRGPPPPMTLF